MSITYEHKYDVTYIYNKFKKNRVNAVSYLGTSNNGKLEPDSSAYLSYINNSTETYIYARKSSPTIEGDTYKNYAYLKVGDTTYNLYHGHAYTYTETVTGNGVKPILIAYDFVNQISTQLEFKDVSISHNASPINDIPQTVNVFSPVSYIIENGEKSLKPKNEYSISSYDIINTLLNGSTFADFTTYVTYSYLNSEKGDGIVYEDGKDTLSTNPINDIHIWSLSDGVDMRPHAYVNNDTTAVNAYTYLNCGNTLKNFFNYEISENHNIFDNIISGTDEYKYIKFNYEIINYEIPNDHIKPEDEDEIVNSFDLNVKIRTYALFENFLKNDYETGIGDTGSMGSIPYELNNSNLNSSNKITFEYDNEYNDDTLFAINILSYNSKTNDIYSNETIYETLPSLGKKMYENTNTDGSFYYKADVGCGFVSSGTSISNTTGNCDKNTSIVNSFISSNIDFTSINNYKSICLCDTDATAYISNNAVLEGLLIKNKTLSNRTLKNDRLKVIFDFNKNANNKITTTMTGYHDVNKPYKVNAIGNILKQSGTYSKKTTYRLKEAYLVVYYQGGWKVYGPNTDNIPYFKSPNSDYEYGFDIIRNGGVTELRYILVYSPESSKIIPSYI